MDLQREGEISEKIIERLTTVFYENFDEKLLDLDGQLNAQGHTKKMSFDVMEQIEQDFLLNDSKQSLLLLGDSGSGKSTLGLFLADRLFRQYGHGGNDLIPLFIHLPTIPEEKRTTKLLETFLKNDRTLALGKKKAKCIVKLRKITVKIRWLG